MPKQRNLVGQKFGKLTIVEYGFSKNGRSYWKCRCDCGNIKYIKGTSLTTGNTKSCGCLKRESAKKINYTHGETRTRIHREWVSMRNRCICTANTSYPRYGGRGISVCKEWDDYFTFKKWAIDNGYQDDLTIERIDPNGNYEPRNCKWIPPEEQHYNKRNTVIVEYKGEKKPLAIFCRELKLKYGSMHRRIKDMHWSVERAFETPIGG